MPEGHTIHALAGRLHAAFAGHTIFSDSPQGRFAEGAARLDGQTFTRAWAHGKHLFCDIGAGTVHVHLGLFGKFSVTQHRRKTIASAADIAVTGQVRWRLVGPTHSGVLRGPTACELLTPREVEAITDRLGADPLAADDESTPLPPRVRDRMARSKRPVGALLMDQSMIAGVGNVYRAEVLFKYGIHPLTPGHELPPRAFDELWREMVRLMPVGVATGRILVSDSDVDRAREAIAAGKTGRIMPRYAVYRRVGKPCPQCGDSVRGAELAARKVYWCEQCQPLSVGSKTL